MLDVLYTYISSDVDSSDMDAVRYFVSLLTSASSRPNIYILCVREGTR